MLIEGRLNLDDVRHAIVYYLQAEKRLLVGPEELVVSLLDQTGREAEVEANEIDAVTVTFSTRGPACNCEEDHSTVPGWK